MTVSYLNPDKKVYGNKPKKHNNVQPPQGDESSIYSNHKQSGFLLFSLTIVVPAIIWVHRVAYNYLYTHEYKNILMSCVDTFLVVAVGSLLFGAFKSIVYEE